MFLILFEVFFRFKPIDKGSQGLKNLEIMDFGDSGLSDHKADILSDQN